MVSGVREVYIFIMHIWIRTQQVFKKEILSRREPCLAIWGTPDTGQEGTRGKFPVHLHFGVYYDKNGEEKTIDPYRLLRCLETKL